MSKTKQYLQTLFAEKQINIPHNRAALFDKFAHNEASRTAVKQIQEAQNKLIDNWTMMNRISDIQQQYITIPNGTVGKRYEASIDLKQVNRNDVFIVEITGLESIGLTYNNETAAIQGIPTNSGDIPCIIRFRMEGEDAGTIPHEKLLTLVINPDPKTLWKNIPSDKEDQYWKEDQVAISDTLGSKHIVAVSKRGRSHANTGSFRDDDFTYKQFETTGWSLVVVADGAGSAKLSRQGSALACKAVVDFFTENLTTETDKEFAAILADYKQPATEENQKKISQFVYANLSKAALYAHQQLVDASVKAEAGLKDFHTTLIFTLFKKYDAGYAFLSFGVGDCPIALLNKEITEVTLMNWLDVGEFGGGTRFITMPEIFKSDKFSSRFKFKLIDDFSYLFMMTDGVYDAKFVVEANLEKIEKWKELLEDLKGKNDDGIIVKLDSDNNESALQLSAWMDFWSAGNHDDRTLAIVF